MDMVRKGKTYRTTMYFFTDMYPPAGVSVPSPRGNAGQINAGEGLGLAAPLPARGTLGLGLGCTPYPCKVRWFYCHPDAKDFPFANAFGSATWDMENEWNPGIGEVHEFGFLTWQNGRAPTTATGQSFCGKPEWWINGVPKPSTGMRVDDQGVPFCCKSQLGAPAVGSVMFGGHVPGGSIAWAQRSHAGAGEISLAARIPAGTGIGLNRSQPFFIAYGPIGFTAHATPSYSLTMATRSVSQGRLGMRSFGSSVSFIGMTRPAFSVGELGFNARFHATSDWAMGGVAPSRGAFVAVAQRPSTGAIVLHSSHLDVSIGKLGMSGQPPAGSSLVVSSSNLGKGLIGLPSLDPGRGRTAWTAHAPTELPHLVVSAVVPATDDVAPGTPVPSLASVGQASLAAMLPALINAGLVPSMGSMGFS